MDDSDETSTPDDSEELALSEMQASVLEYVRATPPPGCHAGRNAVEHLKKAWRLRRLDLEMAVFRGITAEEEAARAVIQAVKRRKYVGADHLNWRVHTHKAAMAPFFEAVARFAVQFSQVETHVRVNKDRPDCPVELGVQLPFGPHAGTWGYPQPPLNFSINDTTGVYNFADELDALANDSNVANIATVVEERANERNRLLYASHEGVPRIVGDVERFLLDKRKLVFGQLMIYLMIEPYDVQQLFVQQTLGVYLKIIPQLRRKLGRDLK